MYMDLKSGFPFWSVTNGFPAAFPPLSKDIDCDVVITGAGITGALTAFALAQADLDVVGGQRHRVQCDRRANIARQNSAQSSSAHEILFVRSAAIVSPVVAGHPSAFIDALT
jgi:hypothetical protein